MHVLILAGTPIATTERYQRLCMLMADYTGTEQSRMTITAVEVLE